MLPELKATLQQLLTLPQEGEGMSEGVAETETPKEVEGRIRQLLAKASYKYGFGHFKDVIYMESHSM